jgi:hypothetical protein
VIQRKIRTSPGPFTRCGVVTLEDRAVKVTYDAGGISHTVYIWSWNLPGHDTPPVPVFARGPAEAFVKVGYASRSPSGRALIISTTTSQGNLSVEWTALISVIRRERKQVPVSRLNAPSI